jgi:PAS domain S-box-containing protein
MVKQPTRVSRARLVAGGIVLTLLLAGVFTLGSLNVPFEIRGWRDALPLFAVSCFITAAALVFGLVLVRTFLRLLAERWRDQLGARFKTKMVFGAISLSLLPVCFMFVVSYSLLNRTLGRWFPRPLEIASEQSGGLLDEMGRAERGRLALAAAESMRVMHETPKQAAAAHERLCASADAFWQAGPSGTALDYFECSPVPAPPSAARETSRATGAAAPVLVEALRNGDEVWSAGGKLLLAGRAHAANGQSYFAARRVPADFLTRLHQIREQTQAYDREKQHLRALKRQLLLILLLFTVLLLFSLIWLALYLAKQVTVPIQALAEGTREVAAGNFEYEVPEQVQDELGILVRSFNTMTAQLRDNRTQIDRFTHNLQQAVQELERRRQLMETVLESIPTGVLSLDVNGAVLRSNAAIGRMLGPTRSDGQSLEELAGSEGARVIRELMRRALRMGVASREMELVSGGRLLHAAVTVSALGPRRANLGYVVVLDDLTELLRAQKSAAWQEVAQRIAHEIKNPLTPIHLSAQRLSRYIERAGTAEEASHNPELEKLVQECARLIEREVGALSALVNEFSQFVRFPAARLAAVDVNKLVENALAVFSGRLDGIEISAELAPNVPPVRADENLLRSVIVNLVDNAAEALETSTVRRIRVTTSALPDSEMVQIVVADTGHGISPEDKDKLFLPHFSTKDRGTGLGLAITARIVAEHGGRIHAEDNFPVGSRFLIELPAGEPAPAAAELKEMESPS